ncbi:unnamed protein product, partial [Closterium sp. NIES-54]
MAEPEDYLIYYAAIVYRGTILYAHSSFPGDCTSIIAEAMRQMPDNVSSYSRSYDGTMLAFLVRGKVVYTLGGHEALDKIRAYKFLEQ